MNDKMPISRKNNYTKYSKAVQTHGRDNFSQNNENSKIIQQPKRSLSGILKSYQPPQKSKIYFINTDNC